MLRFFVKTFLNKISGIKKVNYLKVYEKNISVRRILRFSLNYWKA